MPRVFVKPALLTTSLGAKYTVLSGVEMTLLELTFNNNDSVARQVDVHFVVTGDSADSTNLIYKVTLDPSEHFGRVWPMLGLPAAGAIHAKCAANSAVVMMISAVTEIAA